MADAVTSQTLSDGPRVAVMKFTNISDGSGESAVAKVDVSALSAEPGTDRACSEVKIQQIFYAWVKCKFAFLKLGKRICIK